MFDLGAIKATNLKSRADSQRKDPFDEEYSSAMELFSSFVKSEDFLTLKKAGEKLFKALKLKRTRVEPYVYLSYIFFVFDDTSTAREYLEIAEKLDSSFKHIPVMKQVLYN